MSQSLPSRRDGARPTPPADVADGIPDRSGNRRAWKIALIAAIFLVWVAFLIYCAAAGTVE